MSSLYGIPRPCRGCEHWGGNVFGTQSAVCLKNEGQLQTRAESGCAYWVRAIGADHDYLPDTDGTGRAPSHPRVDAFDDDWPD
jgi:hypothetical protein